MSLHEQWIRLAYNEQGQIISKTWKDYLPAEQKIYEYILSEKIQKLEFTVKDFGTENNMPVTFVCGFISGISEALDNEIDLEEITEDSTLCLEINFEKLYKKMIEYKAKHLYVLKEWENIFDRETLDRFMYEMTKAKVYERETVKIGRNDPCPCQSGKKYKKCCGA